MGVCGVSQPTVQDTLHTRQVRGSEIMTNDTMKDNNTQQKIELLFDNFKEFLKEKNKRYGDSALEPMNIFADDADNQQKNEISQIRIRLDDKLKRIKTAREQRVPLRKNDVCDVFGYVALLMVENNWLEFDDLLD